jgi:hypothetical protein
MLIDHLLGLGQTWRSLLRTRESTRLYPCMTHTGDLGRRRGRNHKTTADGQGTTVRRGHHPRRGDNSSAWMESRTIGNGLELF